MEDYQIIYSQNVAGYLMNNGFQLYGVIRKIHNRDKYVFVFEKSEELNKALAECKNKVKNETKEEPVTETTTETVEKKKRRPKRIKTSKRFRKAN